jgi:hypothetical protein
MGFARALAASALCAGVAASTLEAHAQGGGGRSGLIAIPVQHSGAAPAVVCNFAECIVVGEQSKWLVWYWCIFDGQYQDDTVTVKVEGFPSGRGEAKPTYQPNKVPTTHDPSNPSKGEQSLVTIDTKYFEDQPSTKPGPYFLHFTGKGKNPKCPGIYDAGGPTIQVRPKITAETASNGKEKDVVWWFADADPGPLEALDYTLKLKLIAHGEDKKYSWKITEGTRYAEFEGGGTKTGTSTNNVKVKASSKIQKPADLPKKKGDFKVTVTVNGAESDPIDLRVKRPYDVKPLPPPDDEGKLTNGYQSILFYLVRDQFGKAMPKRMPVREHFTTPVTDDFAGTNWLPAPEGGATTKLSGAIQDRVTGQSYIDNPGQKPTALAPDPQSKAWTTPIHHWSGEVWIGDTEPRGVRVMTLTWQRFRNHARHCDIASPPDATPICPCGTLRTTGDCP